MTAAKSSPCDAMNTEVAAMPQTARRCLATGEIKDKTALIRFVASPDGVVVPDLAERLGGRGLWVCATRDALELAIKKNLFSRAAKAKLAVPADLLGRTENLLSKRFLSILGLARSAGVVVPGLSEVEKALGQETLAAILLAKDSGHDCRRKLARAPIHLLPLTREEIGKALGLAPLAAVGLRRHAITTKIMTDLIRWQGVSAPISTPLDPLVDCEHT